MKRVLMLASVASMIGQFNMSNIIILQELGYEVEVACNFENGSPCSDERIQNLKKRLEEMKIRYYQIDFTRNVINIKKDLVAFRQVKRLLQNNKYEFIHCHSPIGGVVGRLEGHFAHTKVIYTAHGFHFFKGAPLINWMLYYPIEWFCSFYTDILITINHEDYNRARRHFHAKNIEYISGVGVDTEKFGTVTIDRSCVREQLGLQENDIMLLSVGELRKLKNHNVVIKALGKLKDIHLKYYICGIGEMEQELQKLAKSLGLEKQVFLLGYRDDIAELCHAADIFMFLSRREGLGLAAIEGMAAGLPLITSNVHGINDYSKHGKTGYSYNPDDVNGVAMGIRSCADNVKWRYKVGLYNKTEAKRFDISEVKQQMKDIYLKI